jgi:hypothetical protein
MMLMSSRMTHQGRVKKLVPIEHPAMGSFQPMFPPGPPLMHR